MLWLSCFQCVFLVYCLGARMRSSIFGCMRVFNVVLLIDRLNPVLYYRGSGVMNVQVWFKHDVTWFRREYCVLIWCMYVAACCSDCDIVISRGTSGLEGNTKRWQQPWYIIIRVILFALMIIQVRVSKEVLAYFW